MDRSHLTALTTLLVVALQASSPSTAGADGLLDSRLTLGIDSFDDPSFHVEVTPSLRLSETPATPVPRECQPRFMAGPAVGTVLGPGASLAGAYMVAIGNIEILGPREKTSRDRALIAGGAVLILGGIGTFIYSIVKLSDNRQARRRVCRGR